MYSPTPPANAKKGSKKGPLLGCIGFFFIIVLLVIGAVGYFWWAAKSARHPDYYGKIITPKENVVRVGAGKLSNKTFDPDLVGADQDEITRVQFAGLVEYEGNSSRLKPSLATKWEKSADSLVWTFYLRKDAKWSDGKNITANDFVYSWKRALSPEIAALGSSLLYPVKNAENYNNSKGKADDVGIKAIDDYTLQVQMERPTPYFDKLIVTTIYCPVPRQAIEKFGSDWTNVGNIVVSGAFKLSEWNPQDQIVVERNPQFWDNANTKLDKITFLSSERKYLGFLSPKTPLELYEKGEVDVTQSLDFSTDDSFKSKKDYFTQASNATEFLLINTTIKPFDDVRVRNALSMAIDRDAMKDRMPATSLTPKYEGYENPKGTGFNPDEARRLLAEAGFPNGRGFPEVEYIYNTAESVTAQAQFVQEQWQKELGIKVKLINMGFKDFLKKRRALDFKGVSRSGWAADYADPNSFLELMTSEDIVTGWKDAKFAELLTKANSESDEKKRYLLLNQAETYLLEQQPIIPLSLGPVDRVLFKPYINNLNLTPLNRINWREVYIDHSITAKNL